MATRRKRNRNTRSQRVSKLKDQAHNLLKKEAILETKISLLQNRHERTRQRRVKLQDKFRKLEEE